MEESKGVSVSDIIQFVGLLLLGIAVFAGFLFYSNGNMIVAVLGSIVIIGGLYGLVYVLQRMKTVEENQSAMFTYEIVMGVFYFLLAIVSLYFYLHFVNIEFNRKHEIQLLVKEDINDIAELFNAYEAYADDRVRSYRIELETTLGYRDRDKAREYGLEMDGSNLSTLVSVFETWVKELSKLLKPEADAFSSTGRGTVDSWDRIRLPLLIAEIQEKKTDYLSQLVTYSQGGKDGGEPFTYTPKSSQLDLSSPLEDTSEVNWLFLLLTFLIIQFLILWPYIFSSRSNRGIIGESGTETGGTL